MINPAALLWGFFLKTDIIKKPAQSRQICERNNPKIPFKILQIRGYTMPIANTKKVKTKGMISVNQGQCVAIAKIKRATEIKNKIQYNPLFLLCISMWENFSQK